MTPINTHKNYTVDLLLSEKLETELRRVIYLLKNEPDNPKTKTLAVHLLTQAVEDNMNHYFIEPAKELNLSKVGMVALNMGMSTINKLSHSLGNKILKKSDKKQMAAIAQFLEENLLKHAQPA